MKKRNRIRQILSLMLALALFMSSVPVTDVAYAAELTSEVETEIADSEATTEESSSEAASSESDESESESTTLSSEESEDASTEEESETKESEITESVVEEDEKEADKAEQADKQSPVINGTEVTFNYYTEDSETPVRLAGSMTNWQNAAENMTYDAEKGCWTITKTLEPGSYQYKFIVGENDWKTDPLNTNPLVDGNSSFFIANPDASKKSPVINGNEVTFNYYTEDSETPVRLAGSMTDWQNAAENMTYDAEKGCWTITKTLEPGSYQYKFIVGEDGWITDPLNSNPLESGNSTFVIEEPQEVKISPVVDGKEVTFYYYPGEDETVTSVKLAGSMNGWTGEDFENKDGIWTITKTLEQPGPYEYKFIVNDQWINDPLNEKKLGDNNAFSIAGLVDGTANVKLGVATKLPKIKLYDTKAEYTEVEATYKLTNEDAEYASKISLVKEEGATTITVAEDFPEDVTSFELTATDADNNTAKLVVSIVDYPDADPNVKSPVVNGKEVTFNLYGPTYTTVHVAGNIPGAEWGTNDNFAMTYNADTAYWSLTKELPAGKYEYKFIADGTGWMQDPLNDPDGDAGNDANSILVVTGLSGANAIVKLGSSRELPKTLKAVNAEGNTVDVAVTYALADANAEWASKVTLTKNDETGITTIAVAADFPKTVTEIELTATDADGNTAVVKVKVVEELYKYTIYYYDKIHATGTDGAMNATDAALWIWADGSASALYNFTGVEKLSDGRTWAKAELEFDFTEFGFFAKNNGDNWDWQEADREFNNESKSENVTIYIVNGDGEVYTELPEIQETKDRYYVVEYIRNDGSAKDWYFYTWCSGYGANVFVPFEEVDGRWIAKAQMMPGLTSIEYCIGKYGTAEDGTQTPWNEQDGTNYLCDLPLDQDVIKVQMEEGKGITYKYPSNKGYEFDTENEEIDFYYRDDAAFLAGSTGGAYSVQVDVDGTVYDMTFDEKEQRYEYSLQDLEDAAYNYRYLVKATEESEAKAVLDAYNDAVVVVNGVEYSTCRYGKYEVEVSAKMFNASMDYNQNNVLTVEAKAKKDADITGFEVARVTADLTTLGGSSEAEIDTELMELTVSLKEGIEAGNKTIPVVLYDQYSNAYTTETTVEVKDRVKGDDFDWDEAVIYFAITDRFFDGNTDNNTATGGYNKENPLGYHGGDLAGLTAKIDYLYDLGINTIWLTPIVDNVDEGFSTDDANITHYAHHGYWASDFTKLNPHLGNEEELKALITAAHNKGMKIMVDVVLNHAGYETKDTFNKILKDADGNYINMVRGAKETIKGDTIKDGLSGLPDFITENPEVRKQLVEWQTEWMTKFDIDYYRVDTVKHVENTTWSAFKNALTKSNPEFKLIGEYYDATYQNQAGQLDSGKMDSLLDFAFKHYAKDFALGNISGIEATLADRNSKLSNTATMGGFLSSHDEDGLLHRFKSEAGKTQEEAEALMKVAATLQITAKGQPVIYYGEEIGLTGQNNYPYQTNRYDFDWSKADAQKSEANSMLNHYKKVLNIRRDYSEIFAKGNRSVIVGNNSLGYEVVRRLYDNNSIYVAMNVKNAAAENVKFKVTAEAGAKYTDLYNGTVYTVAEDNTLTISIPAAANGGTAILALTEGKDEGIKDINTITFKMHYNRPDKNYTDWDVWGWANSLGGNGYPFVEEDGEMVATAEFDGRATTSIGYIIRKPDWTKDVDGDQFVDVTDVVSGTVHFYVESGVPGGKLMYGPDVITGNKILNVAYNQELKAITFTSAKPISGDLAKAFKIKCLTDNNAELTIKNVTIKDSMYVVTLEKDISTVEELVKTFVVTFENYDYKVSLPSVYASEAFESAYTYRGNDLGATWSAEQTTFKVWAPTAESVKVALYKSGTPGTDDKIAEYPMTLGKSGVWSHTLEGNHEGEYYTYIVKVDGSEVEACDPYARTTGVNGKRAMIIDLDSTDPEGWDKDRVPHEGMNYTDAVIYELHVRDASIHESSGVSAANKGKYLGLTETGTKTNGGVSTALDHIKDLGVTHVHLLPVYDYGSVDETKLDTPQFNWGYDPVNYNVPEGSYSTDPYNGAVRVKEFKQMVKTMHDNNINVVMDVVYNHVHSANDFSFNQIVPKYFSRTNSDGSYTGATGCGNDTASERAMVRKYIVDSVLYWAKEYHIDGFRFDLVGILDVDTMNEVIKEVHKYDPDIIFYGEGWDMTSVEGETMATMFNATKVPELAFFSDTFRDNLAGGTYGGLNGDGFVLGVVGKEAIMGACVTATTSWCPSPTQTVNYASCHDNYTLKDKLNETAKDATEEERIKMNNLSAAMYMMSEGIPFIHAGEEFLRTKVDENGEISHNSYNKSDFVNALRWNNLEDASYADVRDYYKGLIEFRKNHKALRLTTSEDVAANVEYVKVGDNLILFKLKGKDSIPGEVSDGIVMIFNSNRTAKTVDLAAYGIEGNWNVCINAEDAGTKTLATVSGTVEVAPISAMVMVKGEAKDTGSVYEEKTVEIRNIVGADRAFGGYNVPFMEAGKATIFVTSNSSNVAISSSDAEVVSVGAVTKNENGEFTAELEIKKAGEVTLTAEADDEAKSKASVTLYVRDVTPSVFVTPIELNKKSKKAANVYVYSDEVYPVEAVRLDSAAFNVSYTSDEARFGVGIEDKANAKSGDYKLLIKVAGIEKEYEAAIKITVVDKTPKFTAKQTKKINTFYTNAEGNGILTVTSTEAIANVVLKDCGYDYNFETGEVFVKSADATDKKGVLEVYFEGYDEPVTKNVTIKTEKKKPVLKLSAKTGTVYPKANINSTVVSVIDTTTGNSIAKADISVSGDECKEIYKVKRMDNAVSFTVKEGATAANATAKITVEKAGYSEPIELTYKIKASNKTPKIALDKKTVTLNRNVAVETAAVNVAVKGVPFNAITELKADAPVAGITVDKIGSMLVIRFDNTVAAPAKGNYKIDVVAKIGEFEFNAVTLTVKVVDKVASVGLTKSGKIDVLNRDTTSIVYKTKPSNVTGSVVAAELTTGAENFNAEVVDGNIKVTAKNGVALSTKTKYEVAFKLTLSTGAEITSATQKITLTQSKPKVTAVPKETVMFIEASNSGELVNFIATNKDGSFVAINNVTFEDSTGAFAYDYATGVLSLVDASKVKKNKTYKVKFNVSFEGCATDKAPTTVTYKVKVK